MKLLLTFLTVFLYSFTTFQKVFMLVFQKGNQVLIQALQTLKVHHWMRNQLHIPFLLGKNK